MQVVFYINGNNKRYFEFCNDAVFYDYKNIGLTYELSPVRTFINNRFYKTILYTRILVSLSIIDDIILKINSGDIENILDDVHSLRENILYMLSFEKTVNDEKQNLIGDKYEDVDKDQSGNEDVDKYKHTLPIFKLDYSE